MRAFKRLVIVLLFLPLFLPTAVFANPYFFITGSEYGVRYTDQSFSLYLYSDGSTLTAAQSVVNFDPGFFQKVRITTTSSRCSFWAPADPSLGFGATTTPYFYTDNKIVVSCGFSNPGYTSSGTTSDLIARFSLKPLVGSASSTLTITNQQFRYIGTTITPGAAPSFDFASYDSTEEAYFANPTPTPVPTAVPIPATPTPAPETLSSGDLTFVEIGSTQGTSGGGSSTSLTSTSTLEAIDDDDSIPAPPSLEPRAKATPRVFAKASDKPPEETGEVLSVQSLRELLIPGKSSADKTVVLINLISTLTFLSLLAILLWRLITASKINAIKYRHMNDVLISELSVLESKMGGVNNKNNQDSTQQEVNQLLDQLRERFEQQK